MYVWPFVTAKCKKRQKKTKYLIIFREELVPKWDFFSYRDLF